MKSRGCGDLEFAGSVAVTGPSKGIGLAIRRTLSGPDEVVTLVARLALPRTANVTGANYVIDSGLVKTM